MKWLWVSVVVLLVDQCTKLLADAMLTLYQPVELIPYFALRKAYNSGAAFSFLADESGWQRWFFIALAVIVIGVLVVWLRRLSAEEVRTRLALVLILGGAAGNVVDRLVYGYVIDFIDVYYKSWHWPAFNIADAAISVGAFLLLLDAFQGGKEKSPAG
ncbi:MAG: signal peptidase II [Gammaproteobacteria bacterium]|nr:signal peptidase II [Gammaproteobacteria bacterium]